MSEQSNLYKNAKRATVKEARALRIGDIIECYYMDSEQPVYELVLSTTWNNREGDMYDIRTMHLDGMGQRRSTPCLEALNTDKFRRIAHGADVGKRLQTIATLVFGRSRSH